MRRCKIDEIEKLTRRRLEEQHQQKEERKEESKLKTNYYLEQTHRQDSTKIYFRQKESILEDQERKLNELRQQEKQKKNCKRMKLLQFEDIYRRFEYAQQEKEDLKQEGRLRRKEQQDKVKTDTP